ncbi:acyl-CoA ligase (AMP-forming), exosortase A system-associated [Chlorobium phaeovibrioides]|uniref:AMP-binding protein n=1 Tax=Chlorobium phaeovibrioides TaxID=1094 RepID=UPI000F82CEEB|nr:AMP-binding protein [Chlorobium phaeovibrioides]RTY33467.1 acyl-CoA ligase (AMP-forming), exosortase A system-associated [Chlorobium phaeovibrioides]
MLFSVLGFLESSEQVRGTKTVIVDANIRLTFSQLLSRAKATAHALVDMGIKPGDRVGVCMAKSADQIVTILGILYANAIFVPILPALKHDNIAHIVTDSGMCALITDDMRLKEAVAFEDTTRIIIGSGNLTEAYPNLPYLSHHFNSVNLPQFCCIGVDIAAIIYSSGSTGRPKGIMVTHRNFADGARIVAAYLGTTENDRIASILSFNFDYGLNQLWQALLVGCSIHLHELIMPNDCIRFLASESITVLPLMPAIMTRLFDSRFFDQNHGYDFSAVRYVCSSGGRVSPDMLEHVHNHFPKALFYSMYGLTEAFRSTYLPPDQLVQRPNSIGKAIPDVEILVLDDEGNECDPGVPGELVHRGGCIARGYWNDAERTEERFRHHPRYPGEVLVYSGDLVTKDAEGYITFLNRKDGMLKNNGIRISPTEIEDVVERHSSIAEAIVFGIENIEVGHDLVLVYTTKDTVQLSDPILRMYLRSNLPTHMVPKYIVHQYAFPTTGNQGKIDRVSVSNLALELLGANKAGQQL